MKKQRNKRESKKGSQIEIQRYIDDRRNKMVRKTWNLATRFLGGWEGGRGEGGGGKEDTSDVSFCELVSPNSSTAGHTKIIFIFIPFLPFILLFIFPLYFIIFIRISNLLFLYINLFFCCSCLFL